MFEDDDDLTPIAPHNTRETSIKAAESIDTAQAREEVYQVALRFGTYGATSQEYSLLLPGYGSSSITARAKDLVKLGRLVYTLRTRLNPLSDKHANVLIAIDFIPVEDRLTYILYSRDWVDGVEYAQRTAVSPQIMVNKVAVLQPDLLTDDDIHLLHQAQSIGARVKKALKRFPEPPQIPEGPCSEDLALELEQATLERLATRKNKAKKPRAPKPPKPPKAPKVPRIPRLSMPRMPRAKTRAQPKSTLPLIDLPEPPPASAPAPVTRRPQTVDGKELLL